MIRPNILWICTDQQRWDTIGYSGNAAVHTPNLDRLCREGTVCTHAYCQSPVCSPSRASFLTGKYPGETGVTANGQGQVPERLSLITRELDEAGYRCGLCGKLHLSSPKDGVEDRCDDRYGEFHYSHDPWYGTSEDNEYLRWLIDAEGDIERLFLTRDGRRRGYSRAITAELHQTTWCAQQAIECIRDWEDDETGEPWLLSLNIFDPHPPFDAPEEYTARFSSEEIPPPLFRKSELTTHKRFERAYHQSALTYHAPDADTIEKKISYYAMVELIDEQIGRILDYLEAKGLREKTLILFHSDHGEMLGDHGLLLKGARFYEGAVRVPMIWSLPGIIQEDKQYHELVELRDIVPTLREMAGLNMTSKASSLWRMLTTEETASVRDQVICEYQDSLYPEFADPDAVHLPTFAAMVRDRRFKLVFYYSLQTGELYDLKEDPDEFNNLWGDPALQVTQHSLLSRLLEHGMENKEAYPPVIWSF